jgi:hypothetical protein
MKDEGYKYREKKEMERIKSHRSTGGPKWPIKRRA